MSTVREAVEFSHASHFYRVRPVVHWPHVGPEAADDFSNVLLHSRFQEPLYGRIGRADLPASETHCLHTGMGRKNGANAVGADIVMVGMEVAEVPTQAALVGMEVAGNQRYKVHVASQLACSQAEERCLVAEDMASLEGGGETDFRLGCIAAPLQTSPLGCEGPYGVSLRPLQGGTAPSFSCGVHSTNSLRPRLQE